MFKQVIECSVQVTNILLRLSNLEIKNQQIIEEKGKFVQDLQGALKKEQKLKAKLQNRNNENSKVLAKLQVARHKSYKTSRIKSFETKNLDNILKTLKSIGYYFWHININQLILLNLSFQNFTKIF